MNDLARQKLCEMIANYGPTLCNTPGTCKMVLGQHCLDFPAEKELFLRVLDKGAVAGVMRGPVGGPWDDLVKQVAGSSDSDSDVRWAVESWAMALGKHPEAAPLPPEPNIYSLSTLPDAMKSGETSTKGSVLAVAIGGAIGGGVPGFMILILAGTMMGVKLTRNGVDSPGGMAILIVFMAAVICAVCGGSGAAVGWWIVQMQSSFVNYTTEELNRRLRKGFIGALLGAISCGGGSWCFFRTLGPFAIPVGMFLGGLFGAISGGMFGGAAGGTSRNY
jgi:hypothetical protein